jgi:CheY-like chemotaxis protein
MRDGCDGIEFISFLQQKWGQVFPALLLTGDITPDGLRRAEAKGLPVLHKPVNGQELKEVISRLLGQTSRVGNSGAEPTR